jgi:hypothetical protein
MSFVTPCLKAAHFTVAVEEVAAGEVLVLVLAYDELSFKLQYKFERIQYIYNVSRSFLLISKVNYFNDVIFYSKETWIP